MYKVMEHMIETTCHANNSINNCAKKKKKRLHCKEGEMFYEFNTTQMANSDLNFKHE